MHIKKLEICGFKSFVDRTVIHFDHDVIGIVGPNGCGKSNIVDAIRWCMGEQSPRHLRGKAMEDVIFNGSESRGPHGFAEVTLTFDNSDRGYAASLPPEFAAFPEIAVSRRLFRDGTSEYLLNKTSVRLKDVTDLFLGTGVGSKAYSIVEQGRIGQIVTARPEDRRLFLEEAAGITKYKRHRRDAERKMDQTRQNLLRVSDILAEIDRTRSALKRQAAKAERFVEYREEFEDLTLHQNSHQLLELIVVERVEREALAAAEAASAEARTRVEEHEVGLAAARAEAAEIEARSDAAAQGAFRADNDVSSLQGELARSRDQLTHLDARLRAADSEKDAVGVRLAGLGAERDELEQRVVSLGDDAEARSDDARKEEEALVALRAEEATAEQAASGARAEVSELATAAAGGRARVEALGQRIQDLHRRRDRLASDLDRSREELSTLEAHEGALRRSVAERAEGKRLTGDELAALERELGALRPQSLEAERALDAAKNELGLKRSRLRALEDLHRRLEGVGTGVRALLSSGQEGVLGLVADRLEVAEAHTAALAGLLGDRLQCVVVRDPARGLELLDALRAQKRGRATVAPVSPPYVAGSLRGELPAELCLGRFADHVRHAPGDEGLVRTLLGDALLCRTAADALELARRVPGATAVALDGTVVRPDGVISGGSGDDVAAGMVEQKREMRHLGAEVAALEQRAEAALEHHRALRARIAELGTSLDRARAEARETEIAHVSAEKDLSRTVAEIGRERHRQGTLAAEVDELARAVEAAVNDEQTTRAQLDEVDQRLEAARAALARATEGATAWKERVAGQASLVMERRVRLAQLREQLEAARSQLERVSLALEENGERARRLEEESLQAAASFGEIAASLVLGRSRLADATEIASAARRHQDEMRRLLEEIRFALSEHEGRLRELRAALATSEEAGRTHGLRLQKLELAREHLLVGVRERFRGLNLHRVVGKYHARPAPDEAHRARLDELARLIERMGPVNLDAKAEYEDAERRFEALEKQKLDIEQALVDLERAIKHMNRESKRRFKETFDAVNDLFRRSFVEMFRGGRAELLLTNPEDLLETGVEIVAQPPGKRLGNIELMSGGEKALTAVALIFAIFRHRPSPFCVLDEVDAPLDEANVRRYNDAIRSMTDRSQFILITHIKSTMQSVDALYGVTMGEPGVSRLVSVKVNESAGNRSERRGALEAPAAETAPETRVTAVA